MRIILRYTVALASVGASVLIGLGLQAWTGKPTITPFFVAIIASVWYCGTGAGVLAVAVSLVAVDYWFADPAGFSIGRDDLPRFVFFSATAILIAWFAANRRRAEFQLREVVGLLEAEVEREAAERKAMEESSTRNRIELNQFRQERVKKQTEILNLKRNLESLTAREVQIFDLVVSGLLNKQIAAKLGIAEITVKVHRKNVMRKMGSRSLADLARKAERLGDSAKKNYH